MDSSKIKYNDVDSDNLSRSSSQFSSKVSMPGQKSPFVCPMCDQKFRIRSLLAAHKRAHDVGFQARITQRKFIPTVEANHNRCTFCDRKFDLERTLHIHQMSHCPRITPKERRNLRFTELLHQGNAAPLPKFSPEQLAAHKPSRSNLYDGVAITSDKRSSLSVLPVAERRSHSKLIPCYMCKESFETVSDLSDHTQALHSKKTFMQDQDQESTSVESD